MASSTSITASSQKTPEHQHTPLLSYLRANFRGVPRLLDSAYHLMKRLAILPGMENVGDEQSIRRNLIANFIVVHDEAPDLTG